MNMIQISDVVFLMHLSSFRQLQQSFSNVSVSMPDQKGQSNTLSYYHSQYKDLLDIIKEYSNLFDSDIQLMQQSGDILFEQDELLGKMLKK